MLKYTAAAQPLARHALPVSHWRKNSRNYLQAGDAAPFANAGQSGDADKLLCEVGSVISAGILAEIPKNVFHDFMIFHANFYSFLCQACQAACLEKSCLKPMR